MRIAFIILGDPELQQRFMSKVSFEALTGCWLWTGAPSDNTPSGGYGRFRYDGRQYKAHRFSWLLHRGPLADGEHVLHHCDTPACVNPEHLFIGDNAANVADRVEKGRTSWKARQGEAHPMRKIDEGAVREIRQRHSDGARQCDLAVEFGLHRATVCEIVNRRKWGHVQ